MLGYTYSEFLQIKRYGHLKSEFQPQQVNLKPLQKKTIYDQEYRPVTMHQLFGCITATEIQFSERLLFIFLPHVKIQGACKLSEYFAKSYVPAAVCTGTTEVVFLDFSSLWATVSSNFDFLFAQISWGCE
jgi:hypothetical protein